MLACVVFLLALGLVMIHSIDGALERAFIRTAANASFFSLQLAWGALGILIMLILARTDYRVWRGFAWPFLWVTIALLALVFLPPLGHKVYGSFRLITFGPVNIQPAHLAKLSIILLLAHCMAQMQEFQQVLRAEQQSKVVYSFIDEFCVYWVPGLILGVVVAFVFEEPYFGVALLIQMVGLFVMFVGGMRRRYLYAICGLAFVGWQLRCGWADPFRWMRLINMFTVDQTVHVEATCSPYSYVALVKSGWTGVGLGHTQNIKYFGPEAAADFIASVMVEELGLMCILAMVLVFVALVSTGFHVSLRARDAFGTLLGMGLCCMLGLQFLINFAVFTGNMRFGSVQLPLICYGGFSLVVDLAAIGLLLSIAGRADPENRMSGDTLKDHP